MREKSRLEAHGAFSFAFEEDYTLISVSGSWNMVCADIYASLLRKRVTSKPDLKRCVVMDGREWGLETPDSGKKLRELNQHLSGYYKVLNIACILSKESAHLAKFMLDSDNDVIESTLIWSYFLDFPEAVSWLRSEGFNIPNLKSSDFPKPIPAEEYRKYLD